MAERRLVFQHFQCQEGNKLSPIKDSGNCHDSEAHNLQEMRTAVSHRFLDVSLIFSAALFVSVLALATSVNRNASHGHSIRAADFSEETPPLSDSYFMLYKKRFPLQINSQNHIWRDMSQNCQFENTDTFEWTPQGSDFVKINFI